MRRMKNKQRVITITKIKKFGRHQLGNIGYPYKRKRSYLCIEGRDGILSTSDKDVIRALELSGSFSPLSDHDWSSISKSVFSGSSSLIISSRK